MTAGKKIPPSQYVKNFNHANQGHAKWLTACLTLLVDLRPDVLDRDQPLYSLWASAATDSGKAPPATDKTESEWITRIKALNLSQYDAVTCQSACIGMAVRDSDTRKIRQKLIKLGNPGDPVVMGKLIKQYTENYSFTASASLDEAYEFLKQGNLLITHGWFTGSGHVIVLDGLKYDERSGRYLISVKDPWSEFDFPTWSYRHASKYYDGYYSELGIFAACVKGQNTTDSSNIYRSGEMNRSLKNMWIHRFW